MAHILVLPPGDPHTFAMYETLIPLILIMAGFWIWQNALRARERARMLAHNLCTRSGLQLLDQTVALRGLRIARVPGRGLHLRRCYGFDVSTDGQDRLRGSLDLLDDEMMAYDLPNAGATPVRESTRGNVIELRPRVER